MVTPDCFKNQINYFSRKSVNIPEKMFFEKPFLLLKQKDVA